MENLFKQAQNAGISVEKQAARQDIGTGSYSTSPNTSYYERSKAEGRINLTGAFKGLETLVEKAAETKRNEDFVDGQLSAQQGEALDENASRWTARGYKSFKASSTVNQFVGNILSRMDEFAEQSPEAFKQYLSESFAEMSATEEDPYIKSQLAKMFTNSSKTLLQNHIKSREDINRAKTINNARENIVTKLYANGGFVSKDVINELKKTQAALPELEAYGIIADASYVAMIENGQTGLYEHLEKEGFFNKLDTDTRSSLIRTYKAVTKAKQKEAEDANKEQMYINLVRTGQINNPYLSDSDRNKAFDMFVSALKSDTDTYPMTQEGNEALDAAIMEASVRNNYFNHAAARGIRERLENPVVYIEGKPTMRAESLSAYVSAYSMKEKLKDVRGDKLRTFLGEDTLAILEQVNDELPRGITHSSEADLRTAIMRVYDANNLSEKDTKKLTASMYTKAYNDGKRKLSDKVRQYNGQGLVDKYWAKARSVVNNYADLRGLPLRNIDEVEDAYQRAYKTEYKRAGSEESAARIAANKVAAKTHNILGNAIVYDTINRDGKSVLLSEYFGMNPRDDDDDISEMLGRIIIDNTEGKTQKLLKQNIDSLRVSLNQERDEITLSFNYDARSSWQRLVDDPVGFLITGDDELDDAEFNVTLPVKSIRDFNIAKQYADDTLVDEIIRTGDFDTNESYIKSGVPVNG